ncbi:hypothetical protein ACIBI9_22125 [Nonomuraea sp. NPDC050451]|uniref:preprotein translocase subunit SecA n=1 Tax=Nonomuraea sp. NPDC050451 TaxID=3364364 RepID=UPI0037A61431
MNDTYAQAAQQLAGLPDHMLADHMLAERARALRGQVTSEAYALVAEAIGRVGGSRCSPVELRAGIAMHQGAVAEVAEHAAWAPAVTLAVCAGALEERGVHLMTDDDAPLTTAVCLLLGLSVEHLNEEMEDEERRRAYEADVTVGAANLFPYDHLHDNRRTSPGKRVVRGPYRAVVTDADHVLLDGSDTRLCVLEDDEEVASVSRRAYMRRYERLGGVAVAVTSDAAEFGHLYGLEVAAIAPVQDDHDAVMYATTRVRLNALADAAAEHHAALRPVLIHAESEDVIEALTELLAERGLPVSTPNPRRPLADAGRPGMVTLLGDTTTRDAVILGGDLDWMAEKQVLASGLDPLSASGDMWQAAVDKARRELLPQWNSDRREAIDAGGLVVLGAQRMRSRPEAHLRALVGTQGDLRFYMSMDEDWLVHHVPKLGWRIMRDSRDPITGPFLRFGVNRLRRQAEEFVNGYRRRAADFDTVVSDLRERMEAERRALVEGDDPQAAALALMGSGREMGMRSRAAERGAQVMDAQVRHAAYQAVDSQWAVCLAGLQAMYDDYEKINFPEESLPAYLEEAERRYEAMQRETGRIMADRLLAPASAQKKGWYTAPAKRFPWQT